MSGQNHKGHLFMSSIGDGIGRALYPDPKLEDVASPTAGWGITTNGASSIFASGERDAVIYAIVASSGAATLVVEKHNGDDFMQVTAGASSIGQAYTFGPEGIRIPGGFRITTGADSADWVVVYDVE